MSIESEIERLQIAKSNLKTAIMGKGVHVDDTDKLDTYYMLVSQIEEGSGGGGIDVSATTVTAEDVLAGKKFYDSNGVLTEGTIEEALISGKDDKFGVSITSGYLPEPFEYYAANGTYEITQNTVVLKSGYFKAQTIDVGTRFTETSITPGTENYNIPSGSYIVSPLTIEGDENLIGDNIKSGVTIFGISGRYEGESSGFDTSDATVVSEDLTAGTVAYGKDGKVYGSRVYAEDPMVYFHNGQLKADQPVYLDPENPVTMYTFDGTASPDDVVEGESVYVAGGKVTGSMSHLTVGGMVIQENAMLSIPSKSYVDFENYQLRDIAGIGDLAAENIAKGKTICGIDGTYEGESSGSSMEIYKCASVDTESKAWSGYLYNQETKNFSDMLTEGLEYKMAAPIVGKCYNSDATMSIEYVPLAGIPNEDVILNYPMTDLKLNTDNGFLFTNNGIPELITEGVARLRLDYNTRLITRNTLLQGLSEFTVSLWVKFDTMLSGDKTWIFYESGHSDYARALIDVNRNNNNNIGFYVRNITTGDTGTWRSGYSSTVIQTNKFYHIAAVYSAEEQSLYINGALEYQGAGGTILTDSTSPTYIGISIGPDKSCVENITHLRVFSKALNADQISILYNELSRMVTE